MATTGTPGTHLADDLAHLRRLIDHTRVAMLTTVDHDGSLRSRPLHTLDMDSEGNLWFFVSASSPKVGELDDTAGKVCLSYANPEKQDYVSVSGSSTVIYDRRRIEALWTPMAKVWFPKGASDPDLALLRVHIEKAELWDSPGSKVGQLFGFARAMSSGHKEALGENRKFDLRQ